MSNENFKSSIELVSGLRPKNNEDFPLIEAHSVAFYNEDGTEIRLDEKIEQVGVSEEDRAEIIQSAVSATTGSDSYIALGNNITKNAEDIATLDNEIDTILQQIEQNTGDNKNLITHYDTVAQKLYLYEKDENGEIDFDPGTGDIVKVNQLSETTIQGGSGGGTGAVATYKISFSVAKDTKESFSILEGRSASLAYNVSLSEAKIDVNTGETTYEPVTGEKITYSIYKDNIYQRAITEETIKDGSIDITDLLTLGVNNFKITASVVEYIDTVNEDGETETVTVTTRASARWTVNMVNMKLTVPDSTWEATPKYTSTDFVYTPIGDLSKTVHFILDGEEVHVENVGRLNGISKTYSIPMQSHGVHVLEVYCEGILEEETISTDIYKYILMFIDKNNTNPIIRIKAPETAQQYTNSRIYFNVYDPNDEIADEVKIYENNILKNTYTNIISNEQSWDYKPQEYGEKEIKIEYLQTTASVIVNVEKFPYEILPTLGDLKVDFVPTGRTNQDSNYKEFINNAFETTVDTETGETIVEEIKMDWTFSPNFDWINGGWKIDEAGDSYFCIKAGTSVSFDYNLFDKNNTIAQTDANGNYSIAGTGKEFKIIFKTSNVADSKATWLTCKSAALNGNEVGLEMQTHNAYISSSFDTLEIPYSEEDIIELDINIVPITKFSATYEPDLTTKTIPMIMPFEDGTPSKPQVITNPNTSFKQIEAKPIMIGSEFCDVHIYRMKIYERYLTDAEILNNFIADARSGEEMAKRFIRNQIYLPGQVSFGGKEQDLIKLAEACPDLRIYLLSAPQFTNDKGNKIDNTIIKQWYFKNGKDSIQDNWTAVGCTHNGQGTSSNAYGYSGRNLDFNMKKATITLGDNITKVKKISLTPDSVPTNYLNFKANIASSENANNALLAKRYDRYLPYDTIASNNGKENGLDVKNSMEFYNCVVFIQETNEDLSTHREFNDTDIHFYAIGNIGDSKKTDSSRLNDAKDEKEFCVEIMDWNRFLSSFPSDTMINAMGFTINPDTQEKEYTWAIDDNLDILYELIEGEYVLTSDTTVNLNKTYYVDILENDDFSEDFTYGWRYITEYDTKDIPAEEIEINKQKNKEIHNNAHQVWKDFYRFITRDLTTNGKEDTEKVKAWKEEFLDWFILDSALYYYLFTLRYTMVDNRAKNSFWHYGKCLDGKYRFEFWDYDNDTALGIDNTGVLSIPYGVEESDKDDAGSPYFRAHESTFFTRVAKYFNSEALSLWNRIEGNVNVGNAFDSTNFIKEFDNWQLQFPEELWRLDYERKYKRTYVGGEGSEWDNALPKIVDGKKVVETDFLANKMNGRKKYQRRQFERKQDTYMSSKFRGSKNLDDSLRIRGSGGSTDHTIPADYTLKITPFNNMYLNLLDDGSKVIYNKRVFAGKEEVINLLDWVTTLDALNIKGGSSIQSLGDLSLLYLTEAGLAAGSKLKTVILGNNSSDYDNIALKIITLGDSNKLLETLNICNLKSVVEVEFSKIPSLKRVYAQGSSLASASFANNGLLEEAYLPATLTDLQLNNLYYLTTLEIENYDKLTSLIINNCSNIDALNLVEQSVNLKSIRITNVDWVFRDTVLLNRLLKCSDYGNIDKQSVLTGKVSIKGIYRQAELDAYKAAWPDLEIDVSQGELKPQFNVIFMNEGIEIYRVLKDQDYVLQEIDDPYLNGTFASQGIVLTKPDSENNQYTYVYEKWQNANETLANRNFVGTVIQNQDIIFNAFYQENVKTFTVTWYDSKDIDTRIELAKQTSIKWGENATFPEESFPPQKSYDGNSYFLFEKWNTSFGNIKDNLEVYAIWSKRNPNDVLDIDFEKLTPIDMFALKKHGTLNEKFKNPGLDTLTLQMGYMPSYLNENGEFSIEEDILISEKTIFTGENYINTGIQLFNQDNSFTLAIDYEMMPVEDSGYLVSCYYANTNGFGILNHKNKLPTLQYRSSSLNTSVGFKIPTSERTHREICVIRKVKGDNKLYIYTNNRYALPRIDEKTGKEVYIEETILTPTTDTFRTIENKLCFGGLLNSSDEISQKTKGIIYYAKLWHEDIGKEECEKVCSWIYEKKTFDYVGSGYHFYGGTDSKTKTTFIAQNLFDEPLPFNFSSKDDSYIGYGVSDLRKWLQKKPFSGIDAQWKEVLSKTQIKSLIGAENNFSSPKGDFYLENEEYPSDYFFIPSAADLDSTKASHSFYGMETDINKNYSIFTSNEDRLKYCKLSNSKEESISYWTRTPIYLDQQAKNKLLGVIHASSDSYYKPGSLQQYYSLEGKYLYFNSTTYQHGVLIGFSI